MNEGGREEERERKWSRGGRQRGYGFPYCHSPVSGIDAQLTLPTKTGRETHNGGAEVGPGSRPSPLLSRLYLPSPSADSIGNSPAFKPGS